MYHTDSITFFDWTTKLSLVKLYRTFIRGSIEILYFCLDSTYQVRLHSPFRVQESLDKGSLHSPFTTDNFCFSYHHEQKSRVDKLLLGNRFGLGNDEIKVCFTEIQNLINLLLLTRVTMYKTLKNPPVCIYCI